jgi:hypothetical protein
MSDYKLNTFVHAVEVDSKGNRTGRDQVFGPDDDLSTPENEWALAAITNKDVWADGNIPEREAPEPVESDEVARLQARIAELEAAQAAGNSGAGSPPVEPVEVPPMRGPGSGAAEWRAYARSLEVDVDDDASRDEVVSALTAAGKPTTK